MNDDLTLRQRMRVRLHDWLWEWMEDADWNAGSNRFIGQDENGNLFGPTGPDDESWNRFRWWKPRHFIAFWRSRRIGAAVQLEIEP